MVKKNLDAHPTLMLEFKSGDGVAFDLVFTELYQPLCLFAYRILGSQYLAEDVVQEVFVKSWNIRARFDHFNKLKSFLYLSLKNACFDLLDKKRVQQKHQNTLSDKEFINDQTALEEIIRAEVTSRIFATVDTLPEECRKVIRAIFEEGKTPKEVAGEFNISVSTVNSQKMRGLILLRSRLSNRDLLILLTFFCN